MIGSILQRFAQDEGLTKEDLCALLRVPAIGAVPEDDCITLYQQLGRVPDFAPSEKAFRQLAENVARREKKLTAAEARVILSQAPGVQVVDNPRANLYPLAIDAAGEDDVFVGRIREDESCDNSLNMWIVADNVRKGAALNAVQMGEELLKRDLVSVVNPKMFL